MTEENHTMGEIVRTLERIESQTIRTNGRVSALEKWRWIISGALLAIGALSAPNIGEIARAFAGI